MNFFLAQLNPTVGALHHNADKIIHTVKNTDADLVVFTEMVLSGYPTEDLVLKPFFLAECERQISRILKETASCTAAFLLTTPVRENGKIYNAALLVEGGKILGTTYKYDLPNYDVFDEKRTFTAGPLPKPLSWRGLQLGILICEDTWTPAPTRSLADNGADILISVNGSPYETGKHVRRIETMRARVAETDLPLIYTNQVGGQDALVFDGGSFVLDAQGRIVVQMEMFEECTKEITFPFSQREEGHGEGNRYQEIYTALKLGLKDYVRKNGFKDVLIGLSGGIDSALVAAIAADALGPDHVTCLMMLSDFTSRESLDDAQKCAELLNVAYEIVPIKPIMASIETLFRPSPLPPPSHPWEGGQAAHAAEGGGLKGIAHENTQSRLRGVILMARSNATGALVLSTGNKSEIAVGYCTLYGDMCGAFNPLKDVYKTLVYKLARWRNSQGPVIPENILTKPPTAELRANQTDQDSLPPYDVLDEILERLIEHEDGFDDIVARGHDRDMVKKVWQLLDTSEYKRRQAPPGTKITRRAFGLDRRVPITNGFKV